MNDEEITQEMVMAGAETLRYARLVDWKADVQELCTLSERVLRAALRAAPARRRGGKPE
jgi:hypothetical protein